jgi:hypothetical protein
MLNKFEINSHKNVKPDGSVVSQWLSRLERKLISLTEHLSSLPVFNVVRVVRSLVFLCGVLYHGLSLYFFIRPLYCLSFFDLQLLITTLVSFNFSFRTCSECMLFSPSFYPRGSS